MGISTITLLMALEMMSKDVGGIITVLYRPGIMILKSQAMRTMLSHRPSFRLEHFDGVFCYLPRAILLPQSVP